MAESQPRAHVLAVLTGAKTHALTLHFLDRFQRLCREPIAFRVFSDGSLEDRHRRGIMELVSTVSFPDEERVDQAVRDRLARYPNCLRFRSLAITGRKLFDIPLSTPEDRLFFCDADVMLGPPVSLAAFWALSGARMVFMQDFQNAYCLTPKQLFLLWLLSAEHPRPMALINTGMIAMAMSAYDLDFLEYLFGLRDFAGHLGYHTWWYEQTAYAMLASRTSTSVISPAQAHVAGGNTRGADVQRFAVVHFPSHCREAIPAWCDDWDSRSGKATTPFAVELQPALPYQPAFALLRESLTRICRMPNP